jgi:hypothetical protein
MPKEQQKTEEPTPAELARALSVSQEQMIDLLLLARAEAVLAARPVTRSTRRSR